ncbi:MAG: zinc ABC transporter substrate-binding protein [Nitrospirae bacterium]|nr:zinc ABC transporter substrate-binding protein [Nitrospirota bacterium]
MGLSACQQSEYNPAQPPFNKEGQEGFKLKVLTTIPPLYSFTKNITGGIADVENLLPSGAGPHEYSFSPSDIKKIAKARIVIKNGVNLEAWLDKLISAGAGENLIVVDTSQGVELINKDPHIWLSPANAIMQVKNISDALIKADPENSAAYKNNAETYIQKLKALDREIGEEAAKFKNREFVALHSAFSYFARDYGLKQAAVIYEYPDTEPSPGHMAYVMNIIKEKNIRSVFSEPQASSRIVRTIAKDLSLEVYSLDTLESGTPYPEWYEDKMRANISVFKEALD